MANPNERGGGEGRLSGDDVARLSERIAGLTATGQPLGPGLHATAEEMPRGRLRSSLESIASAIDAGESIDEALSAQGRRLPGHLRGLLSAGSRTGEISKVLGQFVAYHGVGVELRRRLWISLAYPTISFVITLLVFTFVCTYLVPSFEAIFKDFGISLPAVTVVVLSLAHVFAVSWQLVGELFIGLVVFWLLSYAALSGPTRRSMLSGLPIVGDVVWNSSLADFCHLLALLIENDVPLGEALRLTGEGVRDATIERACVGMARDVEGGMTLSETLIRQPAFPKGLARVLRWAEGHRSLPDALHMAGEMFEAGARVQSGFAGTVLAVLMVTTILTGIALIVVGLFLPLITLISKLSG